MAAIASTASALAPLTRREGPLSYLRCGAIVGYRKREVIYGEDEPSQGLYMVIDGRIKVSRLSDDGREALVDIYGAGSLFGEWALLGLRHNAEQATALESSNVMVWSATEIEDLVISEPKLAVALCQTLVERTLDFGRRIESFSMDTVSRRLARCLVRLSERLGVPGDNGSVQMAALTHAMLACYVGTSREIVSHDMSRFRQLGCVRYSRRGITVYRDALQDWLRRDGR